MLCVLPRSTDSTLCSESMNSPRRCVWLRSPITSPGGRSNTTAACRKPPQPATSDETGSGRVQPSFRSAPRFSSGQLSSRPSPEPGAGGEKNACRHETPQVEGTTSSASGEASRRARRRWTNPLRWRDLGASPLPARWACTGHIPTPGTIGVRGESRAAAAQGRPLGGPLGNGACPPQRAVVTAQE